MKIKFICFIFFTLFLLLASCDRSVYFNPDYPDILSLKEGKKIPSIIENDQLSQEDTSFDCQHNTASYRTNITDHQLYCFDCNQLINAPQPHIPDDYILQGITTLDRKAIRIYSKSCSVCDASIEFLLSANLYSEYIRELQNETQP